MLKNIPLFANLSESDLATIARHAVTKTFAKNTVLINEGDETDSLYALVAGEVKVFLSDERGNEIILAIEGPGACLGEMALLDRVPRSASVMTLENSTFSIISRTSFTDCLAKNPHIAISLIAALTQRIRGLLENVKDLALKDVYARVVRVLLHLAQEVDGQRVIAEKPTQQELANRVGASREMVSRIFKDLTAGGYLKIEGKRITIARKLPSGW